MMLTIFPLLSLACIETNAIELTIILIENDIKISNSQITIDKISHYIINASVITSQLLNCGIYLHTMLYNV